jgi:Ni/Fe-hydrogenase subunit HybB-like protein
MSAEQDATGDPDRLIAYRMKRLSAPGLVFFMFSTSWAWIDWIMSLEPAWYSTMHPWIFTIGQALLGFAFVIAVLILFADRKPFSDVLTFQHFNDLGNLLLCFTMVWTYMSIGQLIIVWHENLIDEIPWYLRRFSNGWGWLGFIISFTNFFIPFFLLLLRFIKRNPRYLFGMAIWIIVSRLVDVFWFVVPAWRQHYFSVTWTDVAAILALGGIWLSLFVWRLKQRSLLPLHDPRLGYHTLESEA